VPEYDAVLDWLMEKNLDAKDAIRSELGSRGDATLRLLSGHGYKTTAETIKDLEDRLKQAKDPQEARRLRLALIEPYRQARRSGDVARLIAPDAVAPADDYSRKRGRLNVDAVWWSLTKRQADAEALFERDPAGLLSARPLLGQIKHGNELQRAIDRQPGLPMAEPVAALARLGPGVLAPVFTQWSVNTIGAVDRLPLVAVIKQVGDKQDAPVLIDSLGLLVAELESSEKAPNPFRPAFHNCYEAQEIAIHDCLAKLTGQKNPEGSRRQRLEFWLQWWDNNAKTVIGQ
jgi:hypothetical protein